MNRLISRIGFALKKLEFPFPPLFLRNSFPPEMVLVESSEMSISPQPLSIKDFIGDGFLWAVPKHRRTVERRMKRRFGDPKYNMKTLQTKNFLQTCQSCGNHHEPGILCAHCYDKVRKETELIKEKIMEKLKLKPIDSEVVVLYDGEKVDQTEFWKGKRVVEIEKPRPSWFSKNLCQKTTQPNATTKEVKPDELG